MDEKNTNPFNLRIIKKPNKEFLDTEEFINFLEKKNITVRKDNLPRFADRHNIKMARKKREGSAGSVPTIYKVPDKIKLEKNQFLHVEKFDKCHARNFCQYIEFLLKKYL